MPYGCPWRKPGGCRRLLGPRVGYNGRIVAPTGRLTGLVERVKRSLGLLLMAAGLAAVAALAFAASWPDMEATMFDPSSAGTAARLGELRCPLVITADETAAVRVRFANPGSRPASFVVRSRISQGLLTLIRQDSQVVRLEPGERKDLSWPVTARDAAFGRVVLARVYATQSATQPARGASCGILVLGVTALGGVQVFALGLLGSLALLVLGAAAFAATRRPLVRRDRSLARALGALTTVVLLSLGAGLLGWWALSHVLQILFVLMVGATLERFNHM